MSKHRHVEEPGRLRHPVPGRSPRAVPEPPHSRPQSSPPSLTPGSDKGVPSRRPRTLWARPSPDWDDLGQVNSSRPKAGNWPSLQVSTYRDPSRSACHLTFSGTGSRSDGDHLVEVVGGPHLAGGQQDRRSSGSVAARPFRGEMARALVEVSRSAGAGQTRSKAAVRTGSLRVVSMR
jgi:hypothetical protein